MADSAPFAPRQIAFNIAEALAIADVMELGIRCFRANGRNELANAASVVLRMVEQRFDPISEEDG
jgi:hypothetical protein